MQTRYRLIRLDSRGGAFYCVNSQTGKRTSLNTSDDEEALQIDQAKDQSVRQPVLSRQIAKAYLSAETKRWTLLGIA